MYVFSLFVYFYTLQELHLPSSNLEDRNDDEESNDFWLNLPRTFSYQSSRFELPLDISVLVTLTPLDYLSRYVSISSSRRQLYNKVCAYSSYSYYGKRSVKQEFFHTMRRQKKNKK